MIPYGRQSIDQADVDAVIATLKSDWITQGPAIPRFETAVANAVGARHAVAVSSATAALHIACLALELGPGDRLWTTPNTFVASANCGLYCGATVDFVDIDPLTYNMSVAALREKLELASQRNALPKVLVPVHFAGQSCDMASIHALSQQYGFRIIEDASHAIGGKYRGNPIGCGEYSDITVFSFHPVKIITTGEGGMLLTNNSVISSQLERLRSHGITREPALMPIAPDVEYGPWSYAQIELGFNYRMTDMQAALGASQMDKLEGFVARRHELAARYDQILADLPLVLPHRQQDCYSALHLYPVKLADSAAQSRRSVFEALRADGIGVNVHYIPVHTQPYYANLGFRQGDFPEAEAYYARAISIPMFSALSHKEQDTVKAAFERALA